MGRILFPLDEELGLLAGRYTPRLQEAMTRLGSKLPFREVADELAAGYYTAISEPTCRRATHRNGRAAEAIACEEVERLEKEASDPAVSPDKMLVSADGSYIRLTDGNWLEVKSVATGEFGREEQTESAEQPVKTTAISHQRLCKHVLATQFTTRLQYRHCNSCGRKVEAGVEP